jgi:hypothetical protein
MRIRGGHIFCAEKRGVTFAGRARIALALAMALFVVAQSAAAHVQGARPQHGATTVGQKCERTGVASPAPATRPTHECEACLACVFASALDARPRFHPAPARASRIVVSFPDGVTTPVIPWRAAHPARAPPSRS